VIGFLRSTSAAGSAHIVTAFRNGLREAGFVEGQNIAIEYRWADDQQDQLPVLVADLIRRRDCVVGVQCEARCTIAPNHKDKWFLIALFPLLRSIPT